MSEPLYRSPTGEVRPLSWFGEDLLAETREDDFIPARISYPELRSSEYVWGEDGLPHLDVAEIIWERLDA